MGERVRLVSREREEVDELGEDDREADAFGLTMEVSDQSCISSTDIN